MREPGNARGDPREPGACLWCLPLLSLQAACRPVPRDDRPTPKTHPRRESDRGHGDRGGSPGADEGDRGRGGRRDGGRRSGGGGGYPGGRGRDEHDHRDRSPPPPQLRPHDGGRRGGGGGAGGGRRRGPPAQPGWDPRQGGGYRGGGGGGGGYDGGRGYGGGPGGPHPSGAGGGPAPYVDWGPGAGSGAPLSFKHFIASLPHDVPTAQQAEILYRQYLERETGDRLRDGIFSSRTMPGGGRCTTPTQPGRPPRRGGMRPAGRPQPLWRASPRRGPRGPR